MSTVRRFEVYSPAWIGEDLRGVRVFDPELVDVKFRRDWA
jgi:hypothetical protein